MRGRQVAFYGAATLMQEDCLDFLEGVKSESVDAIIIDPPYCSGARTTASIRHRGGMVRGDKWGDKPLTNDRMTTTGFMWLMRQVSQEAARVLVPGGAFLSFIDWRMYPILYGVMENSNFQIQNCVVWDKGVIAMGNGFRNQHELVIHASKGTPNVYDRSTPNVIREKRIHKSDIHPTEKPVELLETLIKVVTPEGGVVLDCFMGSGPTAEASHNLGRTFIGCELEAAYYMESCGRMERRLQQQLGRAE